MHKTLPKVTETSFTITYKSILLGALFLCLSLCYAYSSTNSTASVDTLFNEKHLVDTNKLTTVDSTFLIVSDGDISVDTLSTDEISVKESQKIKKDSIHIIYRDHSPRRAVVYSMIVPGLGQIYNKKYWKLPLFYGLGTVVYYFWDQNNDYYNRLKDAYETTVNGKEDYTLAVESGQIDPNEISEQDYITEQIGDAEMRLYYTIYGEESLALNRDYRRRNRDYNVIFFGLIYFANIVDAMVDAHMLYYDISDDLSVQITPDIQPLYNHHTFSASYGLGISIRLK